MDVSLNSHHVLESVLLIIYVGPGELIVVIRALFFALESY